MRFSVKTNTYIYLTILLFTVPLRWIISWLIAIVFHEFSHWLAVKLCGGKVYKLEIGLGGADMQCSNMPERYRFLAILCGPIGGLLLACLGRWIPRVALCSFFLSLYNLLPLLPLDGGRALCILLRGSKWFFLFQNIFLIFMILLAIFCAFYLKLGLLPVVVVAILYVKCRKIPCKEGVCKVQ